MRGITITKTPILTQEKITEIAGCIRAGNFATVACQLAGVPERTYHHWLERGKEPNNGIYSEFYAAIEPAKVYLIGNNPCILTCYSSLSSSDN
jgi:hypothetical protein